MPSANVTYQRTREMTIDELLLENRIVFLVGEINHASAARVMMQMLYLENQKRGQEINFYACSVRFIEEPLDLVYDWWADVMSPHWEPKLALKRLRAQPDTLVCDALLDQATAFRRVHLGHLAAHSAPPLWSPTARTVPGGGRRSAGSGTRRSGTASRLPMKKVAGVVLGGPFLEFP